MPQLQCGDDQTPVTWTRALDAVVPVELVPHVWVARDAAAWTNESCANTVRDHAHAPSVGVARLELVPKRYEWSLTGGVQAKP